LGELSISEREEFEMNLQQYPELKEELRLAEETLEALAFHAAKAPRAELKKQLMEIALPSGKKEVKVVSISNAVNYWRWAAAASVIFALGASIMAYNYRQLWVSTQANLNNLVAQNQQIAQNYNVVNEKLNKIQSDFGIIENSSFRKVVMRGTANDPSALASVYWNESTQEVYLSIQNLKTIAAENQFQLWAIVDGKPVDAGVFDSGFDGLIKMKRIAGAVAFAVTIEPRGGKPAPTLDTMQVMGPITKS
jgi:anti-sigma-K factor RskA